MKKSLLLVLVAFLPLFSSAKPKTIHVFVALCDNQYQGIVKVPARIGNGQEPRTNLYWGAGYGVKNFFKIKSADWTYLKTIKSENPNILERIVFKHKTEDTYLLADAYDGRKIKECTEDFLYASNNQNIQKITVNARPLEFGGGANLVCYVGHNGLMDFNLNPSFKMNTRPKKEVMILCCYAKNYFSSHLKRANAIPLLWTTHLMAPEAYTLHDAIEGWINGESGKEIDERAALTYNKYQKCGMRGARNLFTTGY